jgi:hypothetical protein
MNILKEKLRTLFLLQDVSTKNNLLTNKPPEKISYVSLAMVDEISKATINVLNEGIVSMEEELILFDESNNEGEFMEEHFIAS